MEIPSTNCGTCPAQEDIIIMEIPGTEGSKTGGFDQRHRWRLMIMETEIA